MQHFKVKFWNWGPLTIRNNNMTCVHFFLANNHPTLHSFSQSCRVYINLRLSGNGFQMQIVFPYS